MSLKLLLNQTQVRILTLLSYGTTWSGPAVIATAINGKPDEDWAVKQCDKMVNKGWLAVAGGKYAVTESGRKALHDFLR